MTWQRYDRHKLKSETLQQASQVRIFCTPGIAVQIVALIRPVRMAGLAWTIMKHPMRWFDPSVDV